MDDDERDDRTEPEAVGAARTASFQAAQSAVGSAFDVAAAMTVTAKGKRACCAARRDRLGRLPIGFCAPDCLGRAERDTALAARHAVTEAMLDIQALGWARLVPEWVWSPSLSRVVYGEDAW